MHAEFNLIKKYKLFYKTIRMVKYPFVIKTSLTIPHVVFVHDMCSL